MSGVTSSTHLAPEHCLKFRVPGSLDHTVSEGRCDLLLPHLVPSIRSYSILPRLLRPLFHLVVVTGLENFDF